MAIKIIADSTCDLNEELIRKYDIAIVPLYIVMEDKSFKDGVEISPEEIYTWADANKTTPKTAAVGMEEVEKALTEYQDQLKAYEKEINQIQGRINSTRGDTNEWTGETKKQMREKLSSIKQQMELFKQQNI